MTSPTGNATPGNAARLSPDQLVAHRGWPLQFSENTLSGYQHALNLGARYFETDLQIADDGEVWLFHDVNLERLCRLPGTVFELDRNSPAVEVSASYAAAERLAPVPLARLTQLMQLMKTRPGTTWFWELKPETVARHGNRRCYEVLAEALDKVREQTVLISFEISSLNYFRRLMDVRTGVVLRNPDPQLMNDVSELSPEYLFCDQRFWTPSDLTSWRNDWKWVMYTINDLPTAHRYLAAGAHLIETDDIGMMLGD